MTSQKHEEESRSIILHATTLRAQGQARSAIEHIEANLHRIAPIYRMNAKKEVFEAAKALNDIPLVKKTAREIAEEEPRLPSIQPYLK